MQYAAFVAALSVMQHMQPHPLANFFEAKLIRFGQIWLDLYKIKNLAFPKIRSPTAMPKCLLFLVV